MAFWASLDRRSRICLGCITPLGLIFAAIEGLRAVDGVRAAWP